MHIFLDESGTFAHSSRPDAWCVVAAYVVPEVSYSKLKQYVAKFKVNCGFPASQEIKRKHLSTDRYLDFLRGLKEIDAIAVAVATDTHLTSRLAWHRDEQARKIDDYAPNMIYPEGREMLEDLARRVRKLSDQNYLELWCRVTLVEDVIQLATLYYSMRIPATLSRFRWTFDQKDVRTSPFETTLSHLMAPLLQSHSLGGNPLQTVLEGDYSHMARFEQHEPMPWLPEREQDGGGFNIGKIWSEHLSFVDSKDSPGVQVADLITSGIRALMRDEFPDPRRLAEALGQCMVMRPTTSLGLRLIGLGDQENGEVEQGLADRIRSMARRQRRIF